MCAFENELSELNKTRGDMSKVQVSELKNEKKERNGGCVVKFQPENHDLFFGYEKGIVNHQKRGGGWAKGHDLLGEDEKFICDMNSPYE